MLNKRTQILLDDELWQKLLQLAAERATSAGALIRHAIKQSYFTGDAQTKINRAYQQIKAIRKIQRQINYRELITTGRKT